jgi:rubredoxin
VNLTPTGFGIIVAILLIVAVIVVVAENLRDRDEDEEPEHDTYDCPGHKYMEQDGAWLCVRCGDVVRQPLNCGGLHRYEAQGQSLECSVCGHRTTLPYDREASA